MKKIIFVFLILSLFVSNAYSSEEGVLSFSSFIFKSKGIGESGPVIVSGEKNNKNEIVFLNIEAFGKKYELTKKNLKSIPKLPYNGIQLSYEHGYKELGGKTIYISFQLGFNSGVKEKILIIITENGKIEIEQKSITKPIAHTG